MDGSTVARVSEFFEAVSVGNRLRILDLVAAGETWVGEMQEKLGMRQQAVSHHLTILKLRELVRMRRRGKRNYYVVTDEGRRLLGAARTMVS
jgi:DNA-binding transcriptional ArsR family regulator